MVSFRSSEFLKQSGKKKSKGQKSTEVTSLLSGRARSDEKTVPRLPPKKKKKNPKSAIIDLSSPGGEGGSEGEGGGLVSPMEAADPSPHPPQTHGGDQGRNVEKPKIVLSSLKEAISYVESF